MTRNTESMPAQAEVLLLAEMLEQRNAYLSGGGGLNTYIETLHKIFAFDPAALRLLAQQPAPASDLTEENRRLREALEWYAEPSIYQQEHFEGTGMEYPALVDGGHSARLALSAAEAPAGRDA